MSRVSYAVSSLLAALAGVAIAFAVAIAALPEYNSARPSERTASLTLGERLTYDSSGPPSQCGKWNPANSTCSLPWICVILLKTCIPVPIFDPNNGNVVACLCL